MWLYNGKEFEKPVDFDPKVVYGYVYLIENNETKKKYIGKKFFWQTKRYQKNGKKKRKLVESDWETYYGSSPSLTEEVNNLGTDKYTRHILHLCRTKAECAYMEAYEQFVRGVIVRDDYYNDWISCKVTSRHVNKIKDRLPHNDIN